MRKFRVPLLAISVLGLAGAGALLARGAKGPPPPKPACGMTWLNLAPGNMWKYSDGRSEVTVTIQEVPPDKDGATIKVLENPATGAGTTTWTCDKEGLRIDPQSFYFAGEPGPMFGMTFALKDRKGISWAPDDSILPDSGWSESMAMDVTRTDTGG